MKIGILTFHRAINYGAVLQCYGLYKTLKSMGHDIEVIDYRPECIEYYRRIFPTFKISHANGTVMKLKTIAASLLNMPTIREANRRFDAFLNENFRFSKIIRRPKEMPKELDIIFFGSDQIWSPQICFGFDKVYWGQFKHDNTRLITYAASLGGHNHLKEEEWRLASVYLKAFERISVREKQLQNDLKEKLGIESELVVDPTILANSDVFERIVRRPQNMPDNYVLVFAVAPTENLMGFAEKVALQTKSEIVVLTANRLRGSKYQNVNPDVNEFLGWFKYAKCVVTVSFHGTVFSVLFRKDFYSLANYMQDRAEQFLKSLGLEKRIMDSNDAVIKKLVYTSVDYRSVDEKLDSLRKPSIDYLEKAVNC